MEDSVATRTRLGDLVSIEHGWPFKSTSYSTELTGGPIVVAIGNFHYDGGFRFGSTTTKEYRADYPKRYELEAGDILLVMTCQTSGGEILGIPARVPDDSRTYLHNQRIGKVVVHDGAPVDPNYLYWLFLSKEFNRHLFVTATGSKILHTAPSRIEDFEFELPPIEEQRRIAHILGTLDDKIELTRRMNETLEEMARALFKSWFVDFDPVRAKSEGRDAGLPKHLADLFPDRLVDSELGQIPDGWAASSVYEIATVVYGAPFSSKLFNSDGLGTPLIRIRDLRDERPGIWTTEEHSKGYLVDRGDVVVGMDGEFRAYLWAGDRAWLNQRVCVFVPKAPAGAAFVRNAIAGPLAHIEATETATTVIHLGKGDIDRFKVTVPNPEALEAYGKMCDTIYARMVDSKVEATRLAQLRDVLLARLLGASPAGSGGR